MNYNIHSLSIDEKIKLAEELWESIETERAAASLSPAQQQLLEKRILLHQQNPAGGKSWKEIIKKYFNGKEFKRRETPEKNTRKETQTQTIEMLT